MRLLRAYGASLLLAMAGAAAAQTSSNTDALMWLQRMSQAAKTLTYSGVFVYQSKGRTETSRITHMVDAAGDHEKLETLDGTAREVIRTNDEVICFLPAEKIIVVDRAGMGRFPGRLVTTIGSLSDHYNMRVGDVGRVAGREAQVLYLEPRDDMRYGHLLWADVATGLLLKAKMTNERGEVVEQFAFTELALDDGVDREKIKSRYQKSPEWQVVNARGVEVRTADVGWTFRNLPPGFKQVSFVRRSLKRDGPEAFHAVFSDGLATISVFVEPVVGRHMSVPPSSVNAGSIGIYKRIAGEHQVTSLGEVPMNTLKRVAEGVEQRGSK